jgi:FSR family fosmidomycin resistance protein-like MFS transporter
MQKRSKRLFVLVAVLLLIELLDELVFSVREATLPLIRDAYLLDYVQIGLLLSIPRIFANCIEPILGILGDTRYRRHIMIIGGIVFAVQLLAIVMSSNFIMLLLATCLLYPSSGAFVSLSQATLMDTDPERHDQNMARWTLFGSLGVVLGPLMLSAVLALGMDWRSIYVMLAFLTLPLVWLLFRFRSHISETPDTEDDEEAVENLTWRQHIQRIVAVLRNWEVMRWVALLEFSDLMMDTLLAFLALYFVDVAGLTGVQVGLAISVWTGVGLIGDLLMVMLLERMDGVTYLRVSAVLEFILFVAFLLVPSFVLKLVFLGLLGFFNAGWYSVLQGRLYSAMPGQSGLVLTVTNLGQVVGSLIPLALSVIAAAYGLEVAMWFLLLGPIALMIGLPKNGKTASVPAD